MHLDPKTWWYLTRAAGFVAWALLAASVLWGLFITNKTLAKSTAPAWVLDLHRHLGGLAVVFLAVHIGSLPLDGYTHWDAADLFLPMHTVWHPLAIAWGIVGLYLLLAIEITSLLGRRFPRKWWRRVHLLSFPLYVVASIHLFAAGTDARNLAAQWMVVIVSTLVAFLTGLRILAVTNPREVPSRVPRAAREGAAPADSAATDAGGAVAEADAPTPTPRTPRAPREPAEPVTAAAAAAVAPAPGDLLPGRSPAVGPAPAAPRVTAGSESGTGSPQPQPRPGPRAPAPTVPASRPAPRLPGPLATPRASGPRTADERAATIRVAARQAAARHAEAGRGDAGQATAPDSRSAAMSSAANPQS